MYCPACVVPVPADANFCGFRVTPIPDPLVGQPTPAPPSADSSSLLTRREESKEPIARSDGTTAARRAPRFPLRVEIGYVSDHNFYSGLTENISQGGVFIASHSPRPIGELVDLTFTLPGLGEPLHLVARVKWVRDEWASSAETPPGMGVEFVSLGEREKLMIEAFIKHREPIFFDL